MSPYLSSRPLAQLGKGSLQLGQFHGFQQIIDAVGPEGPNGVGIERGGEDDRAGHHGLLPDFQAKAIGEVNKG